MKVKDIKTDLVGVKIRIPKKFEDTYQGIKGDMFLYSIWNAGVWLKKSMKEDRIYPFCIEPRKVLEFTVVK
ncbi:MAG: hypothetical protein AABY22_05825 [Nanoarchaeota archaeon]